jgi:hypothetical protein
MAVAMVCCTSPCSGHSATLLAVDLHGEHGQAGGLLDLDFEAPGTFCSMAAMACAVRSSTWVSSPKTLTATSLRTPEISSLKRSWIGWENS